MGFFGKKVLTTKEASAQVTVAVEELLSGLSGLVTGLDAQISTIETNASASKAKIQDLQFKVTEEELSQKEMATLRTRVATIIRNLKGLLGEKSGDDSDNSEQSS